MKNGDLLLYHVEESVMMYQTYYVQRSAMSAISECSIYQQNIIFKGPGFIRCWSWQQFAPLNFDNKKSCHKIFVLMEQYYYYIMFIE